MNLHLIGLPHVQVTKENYSQCAFTGKVVRFPGMMNPFGYKTYVYASEENGTQGELVTCITKKEQEYYLSEYDWYKDGLYYKIPFDDSLPIWKVFTKNVIRELSKRIQKDDLILLSSPIFYKPLKRAFPSHKIVEYGIGYPTVLAPYKVFESNAWRNFCYGSNNILDLEYRNDTVIPNYYNTDDFEYIGEKEDYLLFMARPIPSKGWAWIQILANKGHKIKVAGAQRVEGENIEWVGYVDGIEKTKLMAKARALLSPTLYLEPFGGVAVEAQLCGTPVITTDWGCYQETVEQGETGFRCKNLQEIEEAIANIDKLDLEYTKKRAQTLYSIENVGKMYNSYFNAIISS